MLFCIREFEYYVCNFYNVTIRRDRALPERSCRSRWTRWASKFLTRPRHTPGVSRQGRPRAGGRGRVDAARRDSDQELKTSPEQSDAPRSSELSADPQLRRQERLGLNLL